MFRKTRIRHQEDHLYMQFLCGMFFVLLSQIKPNIFYAFVDILKT